MLTKENKMTLEVSRSNAKMRCKETYATVVQLKKILANYYRDYYRWLERFEKADRELAMDEKLQIIKSSAKGKGKSKKTVELDDVELLIKLDKTQILKIAEILGVDVKLEGGE